MQEIVIAEKDAGQRLDKYLRKHLPEAGSAFLYRMLRKKNIVLNGKKAEGRELLAAGDVVRSFFSEETYGKLRGRGGAAEREHGAVAEHGHGASTMEKREHRRGAATEERDERGSAAGKAYGRVGASGGRQERLTRAEEAYRELWGVRVVYENEQLLFLDKPAGLLSQSDASGALTLNDWVYGYALAHGLVRAEDDFLPSVANRLDRNTSGLVMAALTYAGSRFLSELIRGHALRKYYHAIVEGRIAEDGELRGYLQKDERTNTVRIRESGAGAYVHTRYRVLSYERDHTRLEVELITGKTHQIRAHLASIGHPLAGDKKYGGHPYRGQRVQQLRAVRLEFPILEEDAFGMSDRVIDCGAASDASRAAKFS